MQEDIEELARAFTGWTYAPLPGATPRGHNPANWNEPDGARWSACTTRTSRALSGRRHCRRSQTAEQDLDGALTTIFKHPNVGPFICRQLIQHLVTSNPSPAYVARVAAVFDDNGSGVRGDMKAVIKAMLLDPEARQADDAAPAAGEGHLREPVLFITGLLRAFNASVARGRAA